MLKKTWRVVDIVLGAIAGAALVLAGIGVLYFLVLQPLLARSSPDFLLTNTIFGLGMFAMGSTLFVMLRIRERWMMWLALAQLQFWFLAEHLAFSQEGKLSVPLGKWDSLIRMSAFILLAILFAFLSYRSYRQTGNGHPAR